MEADDIATPTPVKGHVHDLPFDLRPSPLVLVLHEKDAPCTGGVVTAIALCPISLLAAGRRSYIQPRRPAAEPRGGRLAPARRTTVSIGAALRREFGARHPTMMALLALQPQQSETASSRRFPIDHNAA